MTFYNTIESTRLPVFSQNLSHTPTYPMNCWVWHWLGPYIYLQHKYNHSIQLYCNIYRVLYKSNFHLWKILRFPCNAGIFVLVINSVHCIIKHGITLLIVGKIFVLTLCAPRQTFLHTKNLYFYSRYFFNNIKTRKWRILFVNHHFYNFCPTTINEW